MALTFDQWSSSLAEMGRMASLRGATVGIDAAEFLERLVDFSVPFPERQPIKEDLISALGGLPFVLKYAIRLALKIFVDNAITPFFVFSGLDLDSFEARDNLFATTSKAAAIRQQAWEFYHNPNGTNENFPQRTVETFGRSGSVPPKYLFRHFQTTLREHGINFMVAPYNAGAQLAYCYKSKAIDAISGSVETLLFDVPEVITHWDLTAGEFTWIKKQACLTDLGVSPDTFIDAVLLSGGTSFLPTFPPVEAMRRSNKVQAAVEMIMNMGKTGHAVVTQYADDPQCSQIKYLDRFRKARLVIKHHPVLTEDGQVVAADLDSAPSDLHFVVSVKLLDEMYFYFSKGIMGPRLINWLNFREVSYSQPFDNGESLEYRNLVKVKLLPARTDALAVMSKAMHIWYRKQQINSRFWFEDPSNQSLKLDSVDNREGIVSSWNAHEEIYGLEKNKYWGKSGLIGIAVKVLGNDQVAKATVTKKNKDHLLISKEEVLLNSLWRMFHIRGYINDNHTLTQWGKVLNTTLSALPTFPSNKAAVLVELEEASIVGIELARLGLLTATNMLSMYRSAQYEGDENVKRHTLLISRVASLGKFSHEEVGYTGILSRHILGYHSMLTAVRESLRDLAEACLVQLLFNGDAVRERNDYGDLGFDLPFLLPNDCILGMAMNAYLMELISQPDPSSAAAKAKVKNIVPEKSFTYATDYAGDIHKAFALWDAIYAGVREAGNLMDAKDKQAFDEANAWLADKR